MFLRDRWEIWRPSERPSEPSRNSSKSCWWDLHDLRTSAYGGKTNNGPQALLEVPGTINYLLLLVQSWIWWVFARFWRFCFLFWTTTELFRFYGCRKSWCKSCDESEVHCGVSGAAGTGWDYHQDNDGLDRRQLKVQSGIHSVWIRIDCTEPRLRTASRDKG